MKMLCRLTLVLWLGSGVFALAEPYQVVSFSMKPPTAGATWSVQSTGSGGGTYRVTVDGKTTEIPITFSTATLERIEKGAAGVKICETKLKNVAQTGEKTITYGEGSTAWRCTFNYSDSAALMDTTSAFQAIAQTIQVGDKLKHDHRFDHLGLDADLDGLTESVKSGYAIELQNIAPILQSIAGDEEMMSPVKRKADALLQMAGLQTASSPR
jgi:hypothetical protein